MSGRKSLAKNKKDKAKLYNSTRRFWQFNPITRIKKNKKKNLKPLPEE